MSTVLLSHNNTSGQTYDTITKQREIFKNNPQIQVGFPGAIDLKINSITNKIYVANTGSNTVSVIDSNSGNVTTILVGISPEQIAVNSITNKIYVANTGSNTVSVIDGSNGKKEANDIIVGKGPFKAVVLNNKIYVANSASDSISVINGSNDKKEARDIVVGHSPSDMAVSNNTKIYVAKSASDSISVINGSNDKKEASDIVVGKGPLALAVNPGKNKIYVANTGSNTVSVIDGSNDKKEASDIVVGHWPSDMAVLNNKIYVANSASDSISVINGSNDKKEARDIVVGKGPVAMAVNPKTNKIYVANSASDSISVLNATTDKKVLRDIHVGHGPAATSIRNNLIYVLNNAAEPNTVSVIDGPSNKVAAELSFNVHPARSGNIWCNNKEYPTNVYLYVASGTKCIARPNKDFEFSSWAENLHNNLTVPLNQSAISDSPLNSLLSTIGMKPNDTSATFNVTRYGTFTANFITIPPPVPAQYWIPLYGIIVSTIVGWSIPSIIGWISAKRRGGRVTQYYKQMNSLKMNSLYVESDVDRLKTDMTYDYTKGKISDQHHTNLKNELSTLYEEIYSKKIGALNSELDKNGGKVLESIKNDITDAYAKGKINDIHYNLLNEKISEASNDNTSKGI